MDPGYFYTPTLLTDVDPDSEIAQEEVFGPVLVVIAYDDDDDAVRIANNSIYGLSGAVFGSEERALAVARRIRTGTFSINGGNYFSPDSPFGGYKQSGIGREMGTAGLEEFLECKTFARLLVVSPAQPLEGIRVLEVAMYGFVPSAGAVLGRVGRRRDQGRARGDRRPAARAAADRLLRVEGDPNPNIEHANRGKRSIGLDMSVPEGREVLLELARRADVFLTSFLPGHRQKFGIDVDDIRAVNPKIIYARGSALGPRGEEAVKGGYDMTAFWCRAGTARHHHPAGHAGHDRPARARPTATPSPAPTSPAASPRRCSSASAPANRRWSTSRCSAAGCGRWATPSR